MAKAASLSGAKAGPHVRCWHGPAHFIEQLQREAQRNRQAAAGPGEATGGAAGAGFVVALAASAGLAAFYGVLFVLSVVTRGVDGGEVQEAVFLALQCAAHLAGAALVGHEKRFRTATHPLALRLFWLAASALTALLGGDVHRGSSTTTRR
ncbi:hypothetical protein ZWY2020_037574 [Hordeum vulgare]|nr:hypothetical protein ZWY2020_037574 [Hordeum vulgare]